MSAEHAVWQLVEDTSSSGGLYELEETTRFRVVHRQTGALFREFVGLYEASYDGVGWSGGVRSGVVRVQLESDTVHVHHAGGQIEVIPLPKS